MRAAALALSLLALVSCSGDGPSAEDRVRTLIDNMAQSVEAGSVRQMDDFLHPRYSDRLHANRRAAIRTLFGLTRRHRGIHLFTLTKAVDLTSQQDAAKAVVFVAMTGVPVESVEALISLKADLYRFELDLVDEGDGWRILSGRWERVDPGLI